EAVGTGRPTAGSLTTSEVTGIALQRCATGARTAARGTSTVDQSPFPCGGHVDRRSGQGHVQGAPAAYPARDAHRPARSGNESHGDLGQPERRVRPGGQRSGESRDLDARTDAGTVYAHLDPVGEPVDEPSGAAARPDEMRGHQIRSGTELVQVAARAEGRPGSVQHNSGDLVVEEGDLE